MATPCCPVSTESIACRYSLSTVVRIHHTMIILTNPPKPWGHPKTVLHLGSSNASSRIVRARSLYLSLCLPPVPEQSPLSLSPFSHDSPLYLWFLLLHSPLCLPSFSNQSPLPLPSFLHFSPFSPFFCLAVLLSCAASEMPTNVGAESAQPSLVFLSRHVPLAIFYFDMYSSTINVQHNHLGLLRVLTQ